jgi:O-antigen ligase
MIRLSLLFLFVAFLSAYAWKDWFKSLCGLILLMAVLEHPDMPKGMLGIQGLNPWNFVMLNVLMGWALAHSRERLKWDMPPHITFLLVAYVVVILTGFTRMVFSDRTELDALALKAGWDVTTKGLISEYMINTLKWPIPGLLIFTGARSAERRKMAIWCILGVYFLLALQVIRWMPAEYASAGDALATRAFKIIQNEIGYSRVNMSMMLAGASWGILATQALLVGWMKKLMAVLGFLIVAYGQALTGGRMGYVTWGLVGLILCLVKWRTYLLLSPVAVILVITLAPGVVDRMLTGIGNKDEMVDEPKINDYEVTAGRTLAWPLVIEKIKEAPIQGWGQQAMVRTGLTRALGAENFPHPHNAYLEMLLDNGLIGFVLVVPLYFIVLGRAFRLLLSRDPMETTVGGVTCALVLAMMMAGMGSQSFYPRAGTLGMWAAMGLTLRLSVDKARARAQRRTFMRRPVAAPVAAPVPGDWAARNLGRTSYR